jgi:glycosyltransferase involved in cell wall biosynthesis
MTARVSIALPVYNGENYLSETLQTILAQTFEDFELIITDNASTDATEAICRELAATDRRVRYERLPENIGAAPNFNYAFTLARGEYFKWAAHDDRMHPDFLARCVAELDRDPSCVLAYPRAHIIDEHGEPAERLDYRMPTDSDDPAVRFTSLLRGHKCFEIFGLIRHSALAESSLIGEYSHGDGILLGRLALLGRFHEVPEYLFFPRRHPEQSMQMLNESAGAGKADYRKYAVWFNPGLAGKMLFPFWRIHWESFASIVRGPISIRQQLACLGPLLKRIWIRRRLLRGEVTFHVRRIFAGRRTSEESRESQ